jgi:hypothetical protein
MRRTPAELATELDRLDGIPRRDLKRADPSVREAVERARQVPTTTTRDVAEKLARHAVLLRRFGRFLQAQEAAQVAVDLYEQRSEARTDARERGYEAYARFVCAIVWFHAGDRGAAHPMALETFRLFRADLPSLSPPSIFDLVSLLMVLAQTHRDRGEMAEARQAIVDAKAIADELKHLPFGPPGSVPSGVWGLPVNPGADERRRVFG